MGTQAVGTAFHRLKGNRITTIATNEGSQQSKYFGKAICVIKKAAANPDEKFWCSFDEGCEILEKGNEKPRD